jgi:hypothetical protein
MTDYENYPMTGDAKKEQEVWKRVVDEMQRSDVITNVVTKAIKTAVTEVASPRKGKDSGVRRKKRSGKKSKKKSKRSDGKKKKSKGCFRSYRSKYLGRAGPPFPAQDCKNFKKRGNDMYMYKSVRNKKGIYQWRKLSE